MNLILLPGNSPKNEPWILDVEDHLKPLFASTYLHRYAHWTGDSAFFNLNHELDQLQPHLTGDYAIFAKSAGVSLTLRGIEKGLLSPKCCIFVGIAADVDSPATQALMRAVSVPVLVIQQTQDPYNAFATARAAIAKAIPHAEFLEVEGADHRYDNVDEITSLAESFILKDK